MTRTGFDSRSVRGIFLVLALSALAAPAALGQFRLPKIKVPKIGGDTPPAAKTPQAPQLPAPVVTTITPNTVPPGWEGQVVFTGSNFSKAMKLRFTCGYQTMKVTNFTVESAERTTFNLRVPADTEENKCTIVIEAPSTAAAAETAPSTQGSPQIVQVTGPVFSVSESSGLAMTYKACFLAEGDVAAMQLMQSLAMAMQSNSQDECKLMVSSDSLKYANKTKVILDTPASAVKTIEPVLMMGNPSGAFRIILSSGKIYNFFASEDHDRDNPIWDKIKAKINKK